MAKKSKKKSASNDGSKQIVVNKKARRDYEILDKFEAGMSLNGWEVKSIRAGQMTLAESYVRIDNGEIFLVGSNVTPYEFARADEQKPRRQRKLLMHRREIDRLQGSVQQKGLTLVPLRVYFNSRGRCKLEVGLGRGKKLHDKREDMKAKESKRDMERALRNKLKS